LLITQTTPDTSGIIGEAFFMQDADKFMFKVIPAPIQVNQFTVVTGSMVLLTNAQGVADSKIPCTNSA